MKKLITTILLLTAIVFGGCQKTAIEGKVIDGFGNPVKDAIIKIEGTQFTTQTNGSGEYSVGYVPGDITVLVTKPGFTDASFTVKIATETTFPAEAKTIYEIPKESGIFLMQDGMYKALSRGEVSSKKYSDSDGLFMGVYYEYYISFDEKKLYPQKNNQTV